MKKKIFFIIIILYFFVFYLTNKLLSLDDLIHVFYSDQFAKKQIEELLESQKKWYWLGYTVIPVIILIRTSLIAVCFSIGLFFYEIENKVKFKDLFKITLIGEFVLVFVGFIKLLYFLFIKVDYTLQDIQQYYPLSYINFLDIKKLEPWLVYPLQTINLFEIAYFFVLVYGVHKLLKNNYWKSFEMVALSYGTGLAIWVGFVMFLTLNLT